MTLNSRSARLLRWITVAIVAVFALTACGAGSAGSESADGPPDPNAILRYGVDLNPGGGPLFDPILNSKSLTPNQNAWLDLIYDRLIYKSDDGKLTPGLLEKWESPDPLTLEVTLRPNIKFQDGTALDAAALKFNWDRAMAAQALTKPVDFRLVTSVEIVSPLVARLNYSEPAAAFAINNTLAISSGYGQIISPAAVEKYGDQVNDHPVGAGPYAFDELQRGKKLSVRKWDGYWSPGDQKLAGVDFVQVARGAATVSALAAGTIDLAPIDQSDIKTINARPGLTTMSKPGNEVLYLYLNMMRAPFNDSKIREALAYAWDRDAVNNAAYGGEGVVTETQYYPGSVNHIKSLDNRYGYHPDKTKSLLAKTDIPKDYSMTILVQNIPRMVAAAEVMQSQLKAVGVNMELNVSPNFVEEMSKKPDGVMASTINYSMPASFLLSTAVFSLGYNSETFDTAFEKILGATDPEEAKAAYTTSQETLQDDVPIYFFAQEPISLGMSAKVHDIKAVRGDLEGPNIIRVYMTK